ncbi:MAG: hypothetical protein HYW86_00155 [Candidatus Roizmanbacteria bacterium]|nr:MAG: hypothetical protein HYW86_00155 [Candidatus Roizmanbacteria bacterium]
MKVMPSVLTNSPEEFSLQMNRLTKYFSYFQIDIADGQFVPNVTTKIEDIALFQRSKILDLRSLMFDFHLMVVDYEKEIEKLVQLSQLIKINIIFIHHSLRPNLQKLSQDYPQFSFAPTLDTRDQVEDIKKYYDPKKLQYLQIMTVTPGFQGSSFINDSLKKIEHLRLVNYRAKIYIDGAVNDHSIPSIMKLKYQPDFLCPGSFLSKAENLEERINYLKSQNLIIA